MLNTDDTYGSACTEFVQYNVPFYVSKKHSEWKGGKKLVLLQLHTVYLLTVLPKLSAHDTSVEWWSQ